MIWRGNSSPEESEGSREPARPEPPRATTTHAAPDAIGRQVEAILEAAERAAADIRREAEEWAERHMEETRRRADEAAAQRVRELSTITDDLLDKARSVAKQSGDLISALDAGARKALGRERPESNERPSVSAPPAGTPVVTRAPEQPEKPEKPRDEPRRDGGVSEGARLLATQMAVAGSSRETIAARLREEFGIQDPSAILDDAGL